MNYFKALFFLIFLIITLNAYAYNVNTVDIEADSFEVDEETGIITAIGNVSIKKDDMMLYTNKIIYNKKDNVITIPEEFKFYRDFISYGKGLTYNIDEKRGTLEEGDIYFLSDDPTKRRYFTGKNITLLDKESALIGEGIATSCEGDKRDWYISGKDLRVVAGEYLTGKHVILKFLGIPLFYTPYFIAPVKTERETGLLMPTFGVSGENGFLLKQPYYIVIDESSDITTTLRLRTKNSVGLENEYRYMLSHNSSGIFDLNLIHNYDKNKLFYLVKWNHTAREEYTFDADLNYFNPRNYFKEYEDDSEYRNVPYVRSTAFFEKTEERDLFNANLLLTKRALIEKDVKSLQKIEINKEKLMQKSSIFNYNYELSLAGLSDQKNEQHLRGIFDGNSFLISNTTWGNLSLDANLRYNLYSRSADKGEFATKGYFNLKPNAIFDKAYIVNDKFIVLNTISPSLVVPLSISDYEIKTLDYKDIFEKSKKATINFEEKWYNLETLEQFLYIFLSQGYLFTDRPSDTPLSDLEFKIRYTKKALSLYGETNYGHDEGKIKRALVSANYNGDFTKIALSYNFQYRENEFLFLNIWQRIKDNKAITGKLRYDIKMGDVREVSLGGELKKDCYSFSLSLIRKTLPTEYLVLFNLNLYGLGEFKQSL
ncbi:MAG: hypothetical protein N2202_01745 [Proteobacteria bacterium]|nr:hypothetical protein [Pseudomonadota bacterium]